MKTRKLIIPFLALLLPAWIFSSSLQAGVLEPMQERPTDNILACTDPNGEKLILFDAEESSRHSRYARGQTFTPATNCEVDKIGIQFGGGAGAFSELGSGGKIKVVLFEYDEVQFRREQWGTFSNPLDKQGTVAVYEEIFDFNATMKGDWLVFNLAKKPVLKASQPYGFAIWISSENSGTGRDAWMALLMGDNTYPAGNLICIQANDTEYGPGNTVHRGNDLNFFIQGKAR